MEKEFVKVRSRKDILTDTILAVSGVTMILCPLPASLNALGWLLLFSGAATAIFLKTGYKDKDSGARYTKTERYFAQDMKETISMALRDNKAFDGSREDSGTAVRLDIYSSRKSGKAYLRLFSYIPYRYEPCTGMYEFDLAEAEKFVK